MQFVTDADMSLLLGCCLKFAVERPLLILKLAVVVCARTVHLFSVVPREETYAIESTKDPLRIQVAHSEEKLWPMVNL